MDFDGQALVSETLVAAGIRPLAPLPLIEGLEARYYSNSDLEAFLKDYAQRCSHMARLYSIGKSVNGTTLWAIEISDEPDVEEAEAEFKYVGNMHGDEPLGRQLLLYLANWLCSNYKRNPQATRIVSNLRLHLLPTMNPDGFHLHRRGNANGVDLNRAFPDQFNSTSLNSTDLEPEVKAVMEWSLTHAFIASASFHEGALVANYPWDGTPNRRTYYSECPDDDTFRMLAETYSKAHPLMWRSKEFEKGITNGAAWYPLFGGMQDWNYIVTGCLDLTVEMNDDKWPPQEESGIHGTVLSAATGKPVGATVHVEGLNKTISARARFGDFYRILPPGSYKVTVSCKGHRNSSTEALVLSTVPTSLDFLLEPENGFSSTQAVQRLRGQRGSFRLGLGGAGEGRGGGGGDGGGGDVDKAKGLLDGVTEGGQGIGGERGERLGEGGMRSGEWRYPTAHDRDSVRDSNVPQGRGDERPIHVMKEVLLRREGESGSHAASSPTFLVLSLLVVFVLFSTFLLLRTRRRRSASRWGRYV